MPTYKLQIGDEIREYTVVRQGDMLRLTHGTNTHELHLLEQNGRFLHLAIQTPQGTRQLIRAAGAMQGDTRQLWVNGRGITATRIRRRAGTAASAGSLAATIPAVVSEILVNLGDHVNAGDKLILLESMKMVIPIQAPHSGTVIAINTTTGESVAAGVPLIELDEKNGDG